MGAQVGLTAAQLLELVDAGTGENAAARGRLLGAAASGRPGDGVDRLSLGGRDAWILALRCATFGDVLPARVVCPDCGLMLSVKVPRAAVSRQEPPDDEDEQPIVHVEHGSLAVEARSPDGAVLAAAARCLDVESARLALIRGCVLSAWRDGEPVDPDALDHDALQRIGEAILESDPQAEVGVTMTCASCGHQLGAVLDIAEFFWREVSATSVQLLDEVHQLAIGYGWSEEQVLRLSSRRRREYVERLTSE
jgi:hypothetical protein